MIVLVRAHEAGKLNGAGQPTLVGERRGLGTQHDGVLLADAHPLARGDGQTLALDVQHSQTVLRAGHFAAQEVRLADEVGDELAHGVIVDLLRRADLSDDALVHDDDLVRERHRLALVVRDVDGGDADLLLDAADLGAHGNAQLGVEVRERLVEEQHARLDDQRAGKRHALLLTAGELVGHAALHARQLDEVEDVHDALADLVLRHLAQLQAVGHVVEHVVVRQQGVGLEHHRGVALVGREGVDRLVTKVDLALVGAFKARDHAQRGGLAAAGGAE